MLNITKKFIIEDLIKLLKELFYRFPISLLLIAITSGLLFYITYDGIVIESFKLEIYRKVIITWIITFFLSAWIHLLREKYNKSPLIHLITLLFVFYYLYYFGSLERAGIEIFPYIFLTFIWVLSFLFISPFISKSTKNLDNYYVFFYNLATWFLLTAIIWVLLFALWSIGIMSIFLLFDLDNLDNRNIYIYWSIISFIIISPIFWLYKLPKSNTTKDLTFTETKFFSFLIKYVGLPFILVYFTILYTYSIKVLLDFTNWPNWEVAWMVIWFSFFWYLIYIFSYWLEKINSFIKWFRILFPFFVLPQLIMLFYAIYLRINQYDLTMNRYFVVTFWIWLLIISLYLIISKNKYIRFIPYSLMIIVILISNGPWSVYYLPKYRQIIKLENNLIEAKILQKWTIIPLNDYSDIPQELSKEIYWWIEYLSKYWECEYIKGILFSNQLQELENAEFQKFSDRKRKDLEFEMNNDEPNQKIIDKINNREYIWLPSYLIVNEVTKQIKVKKYFNDIKNLEDKYIHLWSDNLHFPLITKWYESVINIYWVENMEELNAFKKDKPLYFVINHENQNLYLKSYNNIVKEKSIKDIFNTLQVKIEKSWINWIKVGDLIYETDMINNDVTDINIKIYFDKLSINNPKYTKENWNKYNYIKTEWYVLIKEIDEK